MSLSDRKSFSDFDVKKSRFKEQRRWFPRILFQQNREFWGKFSIFSVQQLIEKMGDFIKSSFKFSNPDFNCEVNCDGSVCFIPKLSL